MNMGAPEGCARTSGHSRRIDSCYGDVFLESPGFGKTAEFCLFADLLWQPPHANIPLYAVWEACRRGPICSGSLRFAAATIRRMPLQRIVLDDNREGRYVFRPCQMPRQTA